jgi:hypothetical protein
MLEKVLEDNPTDEAALHDLCTAYKHAGRAGSVATTLERLLPGLPATSDPAAERSRAALWEEMGNAVAERDLGAGIVALEQAVVLDTERLSARLQLAKLYAQRPDHAALALENHRSLVHLDPTCEGSLRALAADYLPKRPQRPSPLLPRAPRSAGPGQSGAIARFWKPTPCPCAPPTSPTREASAKASATPN